MKVLVGALAGACLGALAMYLAGSRDVRAGVLPLFPVFALLVFVFVGVQRDAAFFTRSAQMTFLAMPAYIAFIAFCAGIAHWAPKFIERHLVVTLLLATAVWGGVLFGSFGVRRWFLDGSS